MEVEDFSSIGNVVEGGARRVYDMKPLRIFLCVDSKNGFFGRPDNAEGDTRTSFREPLVDVPREDGARCVGELSALTKSCEKRC